VDDEGLEIRPPKHSFGVRRMICPKCGTEMNHHADKIDYAAEEEPIDTGLGGVLKEIYTCPKCGDVETQTAKT
jgi:ribosomal protein S27AE